VVGPPDLNPSQVDFWAGAIATAVQAVSWHEDLRRHFWQQSYLDPAATAAFHQQQTVVLGDALAGLGLKADG
jgi:tripartite-type tricarboxylate transporter receptor subunit TctC